MPVDRGYLDTATVTAADIRRAWLHMRERCGLIATSACRDELIRQAIRQEQARATGIPVPPVARPNHAALIARQTTPTPSPQTGEGQR